MDNLPVEITEFYHIPVDDPDLADTPGCHVREHRAAQAACAHYDHGRPFQIFLS